MRIDIWSDVVCPFCWIGKGHREEALGGFPAQNPDEPVEIAWRAYELDPDAGAGTDESSAQMLARKYGMSLAEAESTQEQMAARFTELGLEFNWRQVKRCSTFDAHRLSAAAADPAVLRRIGSEAGIPAEALDDLLAGDAHADSVRQDVETARGIGVQGVPFFVFNRRLAVSGAQPVEVLAQALDQAIEA